MGSRSQAGGRNKTGPLRENGIEVPIKNLRGEREQNRLKKGTTGLYLKSSQQTPAGGKKTSSPKKEGPRLRRGHSDEKRFPPQKVSIDQKKTSSWRRIRGRERLAIGLNLR